MSGMTPRGRDRLASPVQDALVRPGAEEPARAPGSPGTPGGAQEGFETASGAGGGQGGVWGWAVVRGGLGHQPESRSEVCTHPHPPSNVISNSVHAIDPAKTLT